MKKIRRSALMVMFAMVAASIISVGTVYADGEPPGGNPACGAEPTGNPSCVDQSGTSCTTKTACDGPYGVRFGYCCTETLTHCTRYVGRWRCCNQTWKTECIAEAPVIAQSCNTVTGHCY